ncbi:MAG: MFS transporter, partial [Gammaproteobacteria bacterium]|nr:MFS transporter [Gammaproteobacteria bacterium]
LAQGSGQLMFFRVLTGFGIGGVLPSLNTLVAEYAPHRQRNLMVSLMHLGYPLGAIVGGLLASVLIPAQGWPAVFFVGGAAPLLLLPVVAKLLPESMVWLSRRSDDQSRRRLAGLLARLQLSEISADAPPSAIAGRSATSGGGSSNLTALFRDVPPGNTLLLWIAFFMGYLAIYFLMSWIPTILVDAGYALKQGINAGIVINLGGAIGMLLLARLTTHSQPGRRIGLFFAGATFAMFGIGQMAHSSTGILIMGFACGLLGLGALIGLYTFAARLYPAPVRATGTGWAIGLGRFGAILGPAVGGLLIALEWALPSYFTLLALPFAVAAVAVSLIRIPTGTTGTPQP